MVWNDKNLIHDLDILKIICLGIKSTTSVRSSNGKPSRTVNSSFPKNYQSQSHNSLSQSNNQNNLGIDQRLFHQTLNHSDHNGDDNKKRSQNSLSFSIITDRYACILHIQIMFIKILFFS